MGLLMNESIDHLDNWIDESFFKQGAFSLINDNQTLLLGKGGYFSEKKIPEKNVFFYIKEFYRPQYYYYYPEDILEIDKQKVELALADYNNLTLKYEIKENYDDLFLKDFQDLQKELDHDFKKAVLISSEKIQVDNPINFKKRLFYKTVTSKVGLPYGLWNQKFSIMGSTPEILFDIKANNIHTVALAGTAKKGDEEILRTSLKDKIEHDLVIESINHSLEPFCTKIDTGETYITPYSKMIHLRTDIKGVLKDHYRLFDLVDTLSPTAALGGQPKTMAKNFLEKSHYSKKFPNRFFGSVFGVNHFKNNRALVMIRNIQLKDDELIIESGAGVIKESNASSELNEIKLKRETVKELFL